MALKQLDLKYATKRDRDYKLSDGGGLFGLIRPNGSKLWWMKYRFNGKEKMRSFGSYPAVSLSDARAQRTKAKAALDDDKDPGAKEAAPASAMTFEAVAREWHALRLDSLDPGHAERRMARLNATPSRRSAQEDWRRHARCQPTLEAARQPDLPLCHFQRLGHALEPQPSVKRMARVGFEELPDLVRAIDGYDGKENPRRRAITRAALLFTLLAWRGVARPGLRAGTSSRTSTGTMRSGGCRPTG